MKEYSEVRIDMTDSMASNYEANRQCIEDYEFATVSGAMWKGSYYENFKNKPRPEINKIFLAVNRLLGKKQRLEFNAVIVSNSDDANDEDAELLQGRWRNDFQNSDGVEAVNNADQEAFFGGFGAMKLVSKYDDDETPDPERQHTAIEPIYSAASSVIFSPSVRKDKADCRQAWHVIRTSRKGMELEHGEITSVNAQVDWFDWSTDTDKDIYLAHYYEIVEKTLTEYHFPTGYIVTSGDGIKDSEGNKLTRQELDDLKLFNDYETVRRKVKYCEYALMDGEKFLTKPQRTPFKRIPVIPQYGYYQVINGIEYYCGEVRKRRDPQMFLNTYESALMQILQAPQVRVPEYAPEQISRHATQRSKANVDNAAFVMSDPLKNPDGSIAHAGPIGYQEPPQIGSGLAAAGQQLQADLVDLSGHGQQSVPSNASADAIQQVNERSDDGFQPLMQNSMQAIRTACEVWLDAAKKLYFDRPRKIRILGHDGTSYSQVETMQYGQDQDGNFGPYKNCARGRYSVQVKAGETYQSKKEKELETTLQMLQYADTNSPMGQMLLNQAIVSTTGEGGERPRTVANYQIIDIMLQMGLDPKPKNEEEEEYITHRMQQMQQQQQQPDPQTILMLQEAEARAKEGQAAIQNEVNDANKIAVDMFNAETKRMDMLAKSQKIGAEINKLGAETNDKYIESGQRSAQSLTSRH